jgi:hypothetical protein
LVTGRFRRIDRDLRLCGPSTADAECGLAMAFKLIEAAQDRRRAVNGSQLVARVRAGA